MEHKLYRLILLVVAVFSLFLSYSCDEDGLTAIGNNMEMKAALSDYEIFQGNPADLIPAGDFHLYELATELFTDYAEKQRLINVPTGETLTSNAGDLPDFPDGTILVKTFYYYNDTRDPAKGKKIIETRLEIKSNSRWNVGTYLWNMEQTDAVLITTGINKTINWIDQQGNGNVISYHIPSSRECSTCHHKSGKITPIGPKLRNLNVDVTRNGTIVNQLTHLYHSGVLDNAADPASIPALPRWQNTGYSQEERARAYLDVNCGHCHNSNGVAADTRLKLNYETSFGNTRIGNFKKAIVVRMEDGTMPRIGTSLVHEEALALIRDYINSL